MTSISIFSGGAAHGIVKALTPAFTAATGLGIDGTFGAVGGLKERLLAGERPDMVILTAAIVAELETQGRVLRGESRAVGDVATAVALRVGDPGAGISATEDLRELLARADAIYFPDPEQATAGIHFANVLKRLALFDATRSRHRTYPNGATAMAALAASAEILPVGCTQLTEIVSTPGVRSIGDLPGNLGLRTTYVAAHGAGSSYAEAVRWLTGALADPENTGLRRACGFA